jgi:hypothetical protein
LVCGWVHIGVSRKYAEKAVKNFNAYFDALPKAEQQLYYQKANIAQYESCALCGAHYSQMRKYIDGDCPDGATLGPIIIEEDKE